MSALTSNPPKTIVVGPSKMRVVVDSDAINACSVSMAQSLDGHTDHEKQTITINPSLVDTPMQRTILHEGLHVCWEHAALDVLLGDGEIQEKVIRALEAPLLDMLQRSPGLLDYLRG